MIKIVIDGRLDGLNELINANRRNKYAGAKLKRDNESIITNYIKTQCNVKFERVRISIDWYEKNKRRDFDNIASAKKYILDALVKCEVIPNDGWKNIYPEFTDRFFHDKENPRIEVVIEEVV